MGKRYFQESLQSFNGGNWYGWKKEDDNGNKIPNSERMQYQYIKIINKVILTLKLTIQILKLQSTYQLLI